MCLATGEEEEGNKRPGALAARFVAQHGPRARVVRHALASRIQVNCGDNSSAALVLFKAEL